MLPENKARSPLARLRAATPPALRYRSFRYFWLGMLSSVTGYQVFQFSQLWLMYQLTGSPLSLGYVGLANAIPGIVLNLFGGVYADRLDQRRLIILTQLITASLIGLLASLTLLGLVRPWHIFAIAFSVGAVEAFNQPARQSLYPRLIDRRVLVSAIALNSSIWQGTRIVAPALAGVTIALVGTSAAIYGASVCSALMALVIFFLRVPPVAGRAPVQRRPGNAGRPGIHLEQPRLHLPYRHDLHQQLLRNELHHPDAHLRRGPCSRLAPKDRACWSASAASPPWQPPSGSAPAPGSPTRAS